MPAKYLSSASKLIRKLARQFLVYVPIPAVAALSFLPGRHHRTRLRPRRRRRLSSFVSALAVLSPPTPTPFPSRPLPIFHLNRFRSLFRPHTFILTVDVSWPLRDVGCRATLLISASFIRRSQRRSASSSACSKVWTD